MHRIEDVVDVEAPGGAPLGVVEEARGVRVGQPFGQDQRRGLGVGLVAEPGEDGAVLLADREAGDQALALQVAAGQAGDLDDGALPVDLHAVVEAGDAVAEVLAEGERGAAVRAAVGDHVEFAGGTAEEQPGFAEADDAFHLAVRHEVRGQDGVPLVAQAGGVEVVGGLGDGVGGGGGGGHLTLPGGRSRR